MANTYKATFELDAQVQGVIDGFTKIQAAAKKLDLGKAFNNKLDDMMARLTKNGQKMSEAVQSGFKKTSDLTKFKTGMSGVESTITSIVRLIEGIDPKKLALGGPELDNTRKQLEALNEEFQKLSGEFQKSKEFKNFENFLKSVDSSKHSTKALQQFYEALKSGKIDQIDMQMKGLENTFKLVQRRSQSGSESMKFWETAVELATKATQKYTTNGANILIERDEVAAKVIEQETAAFQENERIVNELKTDTKDYADNTHRLTSELDQAAGRSSELNQSLEHFQQRAQYFFGLENGVRLFRRAVRSAFNDVKELDKVMAQTAVVTDFSIGDLWSQLPDYTKRANALGISIKSAYEAATLYYQQGLKTNQVIEVSTQTLKMARIAGLDAATATDRMTNALRGFNMEINETNAERIADVYSKLAAMSASNVDEISTAMTKVASLASNANMSFEKTAAFLSQIIETTRESAETAGTALKTVVARFSEVKELYTKGQLLGTDAEGEEININRVSKALKTAGINLNEYFTGMKGLDDIFMELASKWDSLDEVQQRYIATMAAGSRQQSRFIAMMQDYNRTLELVDAAENAAGASTEQFNKTLESLETKLNQLKNAWTTFTMGVANSSVIKIAIDLLTQLLNAVNNLTGKLPGLLKMLANTAILAGGLALGKSLVKKMFASAGAAFFSQGVTSAQQFGAGFSSGMKGVFAQKQVIEGFSVVIGDARRNLQMWDIAVANSTRGSIEHALAITQQGEAQRRLAALEVLGTNETFSNMNAAEQSAVVHRLLADEKFREAVATKAVTEAELKETASKYQNIDVTNTSLGMRAKSKLLIWGEALALRNGATPALAEETTATVVQNGVTRELTVTTATATKALAAFAIKIAIVVAVLYGLYKLIQYLMTLTPEAKLKAAEEEMKKLSDEAAKLRDEYRDIAKETSALDKMIEKQRTLAKTSEEWNEGIQQIDDSINSLINKYEDLADFLVYDTYLNTWTLDPNKIEQYKAEKNTEATTKEIQAALEQQRIAEQKQQNYFDAYHLMLVKKGTTRPGYGGDTAEPSDNQKILIAQALQGDIQAAKTLGLNVKELNTKRYGYDPSDSGERLNYILNELGYQVSGNQWSALVKATEGFDVKGITKADTALNKALLTGFSTDAERAAAQLFGASTLDNYLNEYGEEGVERFYDDMKTIADSPEFKKLMESNFSYKGLSTFFDEAMNSFYSPLLNFDNVSQQWRNMEQVAVETYGQGDYTGYEQERIQSFMQNLNEQQQSKWISKSLSFKDRIWDTTSFERDMADEINSMLKGLSNEDQQAILSLVFNDELDWGSTETWHRVGDALNDMGKNGDAFARSCIKITKAVHDLDIEKFNTDLETTSNLYKELSNDNRIVDEETKNKLLSLGFTEKDFAGMTFIGDIEEAKTKIASSLATQVKDSIVELNNIYGREDISGQEYEDLREDFLVQIQGITSLGEAADLTTIYNDILNMSHESDREAALDSFVQGLKGAVTESDSLYLALEKVEQASSDIEKEAATFNLGLLLTSQGDATTQFKQLGDAIKNTDYYLTTNEENLQNYKVTLSEITKEAREAFNNDLITADFVKENREKFKELGEGSLEALDTIRSSLDSMYVYYKAMLGESDEFGIYDLSTNYSEGWADALERLGYTVDRVHKTAVDTAKVYTETLKNNSSDSDSGSGSNSNWKNPFDQLHNQLEAITAIQTKRNQLEREYNRLLKDDGATQNDVVNKLRERLDNLREEQALQRGLAEGRRKQLLDYAYSDKNAKYSQYIWEDQNGKIYIDWGAIDKAGNADPDEGKRIEDYVNEVKRLNDSYLDAVDKADEIEDSINDIHQTMIDSYINFENRIKDALVHQEQERIDMLSKINDSINDATDKLFDQAQKQIDEYRRTRENEETESEIADKEARLAYLRRDTSGANALEIKKLEEELGDARQDYADSRIDQALEEMRNEADLAAEQRAEQIAIEQAILDYMNDTGGFWDRVHELMESSVDENGNVITGSELEEILKKEDAFGALSDVAQGDWTSKYKAAVKQNSEEALNETFYATDDKSHQVATEKSQEAIKDAIDNSTQLTESGYNANYNAVSEEVLGTLEQAGRMPHYGQTTADIWNYYQAVAPAIMEEGQRLIDELNASNLYNKGEKMNQLKALLNQFVDAYNQYWMLATAGTNPSLYLERFASGGLVSGTGPAWLDGSRSHPEYILNAAQTEGFLQLVDMFTKPQDAFSGAPGFGDNYFDIDINAEIGSDYDVDQLVERIKTKITEDSMYRNVNAINFIR